MKLKRTLENGVMKKKSCMANCFLKHGKENNYISYSKFKNAESPAITHLSIGNDRRGDACFPTVSSLKSIFESQTEKQKKPFHFGKASHAYKVLNKGLLRTDLSNRRR